MHEPSKVVVFDLDETLGYFLEFGIFWEAWMAFIKYQHGRESIDQEEFNQILDLYPEFIRPNIISILNYLKHKMKSNELKGVMIYTNNQGPKSWVTLIKNYFDSKIKYPLFIHIISAFKVNGKQIELCRTTNLKTLSDFYHCTKLHKNTQICFLDDMYHPHMNGENVYYIKIKPYIHDLSFDTIITRFTESSIGKRFLTTKEKADEFSTFMKEYTMQFGFLYVEKSKEEYEIDKIVTKKTMTHLQSFFSKKKHSFPLTKHFAISNQSYRMKPISTINHNKTIRKKHTYTYTNN